MITTITIKKGNSFEKSTLGLSKQKYKHIQKHSLPLPNSFPSAGTQPKKH